MERKYRIIYHKIIYIALTRYDSNERLTASDTRNLFSISSTKVYQNQLWSSCCSYELYRKFFTWSMVRYYNARIYIQTAGKENMLQRTQDPIDCLDEIGFTWSIVSGKRRRADEVGTTKKKGLLRSMDNCHGL